MVNVLISLEEFVSKEVSVAEKNKSQARKAPDPSAPSQFKPLKYWVELKKRANNIVTRVRSLSPKDSMFCPSYVSSCLQTYVLKLS